MVPVLSPAALKHSKVLLTVPREYSVVRLFTTAAITGQSAPFDCNASTLTIASAPFPTRSPRVHSVP